MKKAPAVWLHNNNIFHGQPDSQVTLALVQIAEQLQFIGEKLAALDAVRKAEGEP